MKAIMVMFDSLSRRMLPPYGCDWVKAPNFQRLSEKSVTFDNAFVSSMPCMPTRRDLHTGRLNFLHRSWGPLEPFDDSMPEILKNNGIYSHLVSDHYHYWEDGGCTYHNRYNSWEIIRGQEGDPWKGEVAPPEKPDLVPNLIRQQNHYDWVNRKYFDTPEKQPIATTFNNGFEFIEKNCQEDNWFLQLESFDPHEPFFVHEKYKNLYPDTYSGNFMDWPDYREVAETPEQVEHLRNLYAALVSMCDDYLGRLLDIMDEHNMWQDTMLIVCVDHGYMLGEHNWWAKNTMPWYNETAHTPLFIWDPRAGRRGERSDCLVQFIDLAPTILNFFGINPTRDMTGKSLHDVIAKNEPVHDALLFGLFGGQVNITDGKYVYMRGPVSEENNPLFEYTLMPTHVKNMFDVSELQDIKIQSPFSFTKGCNTMKIKGAPQHGSMQHTFGNLLFDIEKDYDQEYPIANPEIEKRMLKEMVQLMKANDAPLEQFERLGISIQD